MVLFTGSWARPLSHVTHFTLTSRYNYDTYFAQSIHTVLDVASNIWWRWQHLLPAQQHLLLGPRVANRQANALRLTVRVGLSSCGSWTSCVSFGHGSLGRPKAMRVVLGPVLLFLACSLAQCEPRSVLGQLPSASVGRWEQAPVTFFLVPASLEKRQKTSESPLDVCRLPFAVRRSQFVVCR